jgi:hypothetical protein
MKTLKKLLCETTIISIYEDKTEKLVCGISNDISRFQKDQGKQADLQSLENYWNNKFHSFNHTWNKERQLYRFLYDQFRFFHRSFMQLRRNKVAYLESKNPQNDYHIHEFSATNLASMYLFGKKMNDLVKELKLHGQLNKSEKNFVDKFSKTRNVLFEHNFNARDYPGILFDPSFWSIAGSDSFMKIDIHTQKESEYYAIIDYYQDYYDLESIMVKIIKNF